jgi:hypothetical protein
MTARDDSRSLAPPTRRSEMISPIRRDDYPYLRNLLGAHFHQDAFDAPGTTDQDILREFRETSWEYQRLGVRADVQRLLHEHGGAHLLEVITEVFAPNVIIGRTDDEVRAWLARSSK